MIYLVALFLPPLYFLLRQKWAGFAVSCLFCGLAILCVLSLIGIAVAPLFWLIAVIHAVWALRAETVAKDAEVLATKLAEKMKQP